MLQSINDLSIKHLLLGINNVGSVHLIDIPSKKARNYLRGTDPTSFKQTCRALEKIKHSCTNSEFKKSILFVRSSSIFDGTEIGQLLSDRCPNESNNLIVKYSLHEIVTYINKYAFELEDLADCAVKILESLNVGDINTALEYCSDLADMKGASVFLIRQLSYITNRYQLLELDDNEVLRKIEYMKQRISISRCPFIDGAVTQLSNLRTSHIATSKRIYEIDKLFNGIHIAKSFINPIPNDKSEFESVLSDYFSFSLFDSYLYLMKLLKFNLSFIPSTTVERSLEEAYERISSIQFNPEGMYKKVDEDVGYYFLRESFLFSEQPNALQFQIVHGYYYVNALNSKRANQIVTPIIEEYFSDISELEQLNHTTPAMYEIRSDKYNSSTCGMLENSTALVYVLGRKQGQLSPNEQDLFVELMSYTRDIGEICPKEYLASIASSAKCQRLQLVVNCLITLNHKSQLSEHQLRSVIQDYCIQQFNGDLNALVQHLYSISPAVAEHLLLTCDETFLATLFRIVDRPVDAIQVRADMLNWYGKMSGEERYLDRAKTLKIDIQINKEKGTIDDSRIYVDPFKYTQWFEDQMVGKLTMALDNVMISEHPVVNLNWKNTGVGSTDEVINLLLACYKEFCDNRSFGIASYLGRRIRHGTFEGTASTELRALSSNEEYAHLFDDKEFSSRFGEWMKRYEDMIYALKNNVLQIKSKRKPEGCFSTDIDSPAKNVVADQLIYEILRIYSKRTGVVRLPSVIIDYCWRLAEFDLVTTKKLLSERKSSHGVFSYSPKHGSSTHKRQYSKFSQEVNSLTSQKFGLMASWFNKPTYASPSTDIYLLFNAVISEVKDSFPEFEPKIDLGDKIFTINGGTYYVIYDALFVLIHNAAKHGKPDGRIHFKVSILEERINAIRIELYAELDSYEAVTKALDNIEEAQLLAKGDADDYESKSGIRKLKKLENEGSISELSFSPSEEGNMLCFEFHFELDSRGKYDDIDS
ncbi:hypothetical protein FCU42_20985 [Vibrio parahaemolyticus]|uniref:hypothetical protein n=1 Tax=Vibrio parahaemolyticus TaxID=670 RepID=UPI001592FA3F|nr:hypothetical protein [Vibrio parahaemolyticus]NVC29603.1 hypothetical protein [Vibrio parahaemolyticus]